MKYNVYFGMINYNNGKGRKDFPEVAWEENNPNGSIDIDDKDIGAFLRRHREYYIAFHEDWVFIDTTLFKQR